MVELDAVAGLDAEGVLAAAERAQAVMLEAEATRFVLAAHWADLHDGEALTEQRRRRGEPAGGVLPGMERAKRAGARGTPAVAEFAAMELGAVLGMGHVAANCFQRDAVNVRFRHPRLWRALTQGRVRVWQAREVARRCAAADLDLDQAAFVDAATTPYLASLPWARFEALLEARIIEADPDAAEARARAAAMARFVRTGQSNEYGLKTIVIRAEAGDAIFLVAAVDRIARILAERGDTDPIEVRRSKAVGIVANPALSLLMLRQSSTTHTTDDQNDGEGESERDSEGQEDEGRNGDEEEPDLLGELDLHPGDNDAPDPDAATHQCPTCRGAGTITGDPAPFTKAHAADPLQGLDPDRLLPPATLYIHCTDHALRTGTGVARMEGTGPITLGQVKSFLGHCRVKPVQVIDIPGQIPVDAYEVPARMREALQLLMPACIAPYATNTSRNRDADHVIAYQSLARGGSPGQTAMDNLGLLSRFPHRVKTFGRWRLRQRAPGVFEWHSPHGYRYRVDHHGTHPLGKHPPSTAPTSTSVPRQQTHPRQQRGVLQSAHAPFMVDCSTLDHHRRN